MKKDAPPGPQSNTPEKGALELRSDDPDEAISRVELLGNRSTAQVGEAAVEIEAQLMSGGNWRLSEQRGRVVVLSYFATF